MVHIDLVIERGSKPNIMNTWTKEDGMFNSFLQIRAEHIQRQRRKTLKENINFGTTFKFRIAFQTDLSIWWEEWRGISIAP